MTYTYELQVFTPDKKRICKISAYTEESLLEDLSKVDKAIKEYEAEKLTCYSCGEKMDEPIFHRILEDVDDVIGEKVPMHDECFEKIIGSQAVVAM